MELLEALKTRRSCRKFTDQPVTDEQIEHLLQVATLAPSSRNRQPWGFVVLRDPTGINELSELVRAEVAKRAENDTGLESYKPFIASPDYSFFFHSSCVIIVYGDTNSPDDRTDAGMAAYNILLRAHDMGLGGTWIGFSKNTLNRPELKAKYNVPEQFEVIAALTLGTPVRTERREMDRLPPVVFYDERSETFA